MAMERLSSTETELQGTWVTVDRQVVADPIARRIEHLIANDLVEVGSADGGWSKLYRDPVDGRFWELTYPESEIHGGGAPMLKHISPEIAAQKYNAS